MENYRLEIKKSAAKELGELPAKDCQRLVDKIQALAAEPRPRGSQKLSGDEKHRIRQGVYRVLYEIDDETKTVTIVKIAHRKDAYR